MQAVKLTPKERELFEALKSTPGGILRQHIKMSNTVCFRLLDGSKNPISNFRYGLVHQLVDKNIIELNSEHDYVLKATSDKMDIKNLGLVKEAI